MARIADFTNFSSEMSKLNEYPLTLEYFCFENNVTLLRTIGVIFSDMEKRETQYMQ